jgi:methionyl aminopeptidase
LLDVTRGALELAIRLLPQRERWSQVAAEMQAHVEQAGFSVVKEFVGHGIGRDMHEEPQVPNFVNDEFLEQGDFELRAGLVVAIEPMVNLGRPDVRVLPDTWTQVTADGKPSAHFEHTVALTSCGTRILTGPPQEGEPAD